MGASQSTALQTCLNAVCAGQSSCVGYPDDLLYQASWVKRYNLDVSAVPAAVLRPSSAEDVAAIVQCAVAANLSVQAKSGGHSYANVGVGGGSDPETVVSLDMTNMAGFSMNTTTWYATIGPGMLLGDVTDALSDNGGRAFAHGICPGVGLGGHATIGGLGPMSRMWGSCLDHIVEVEVVTADGSIVRASEEQKSDLFFAIRGAGASFGIVTEFVMRTHSEPGNVVQYTYTVSLGTASDMASLYTSWQELMTDPDLDRRFGSEFVLYALGAIITGSFYGTEAEWEASGIAARLPSSGATIVVNDWLAGLTHDIENAGLYLSSAAFPFYEKSLFLRADALPSAADVDTLFDYVDATDKGTALWYIIFSGANGALADTAMDATAYAHRDAAILYESYGISALPPVSATTRSFLTGFHDNLVGLLPTNGSANPSDDVYGTYPGYIDLALTDPQRAYWLTNLERLEQVKAVWDPTEVFRNVHSVRPATA